MEEGLRGRRSLTPVQPTARNGDKGRFGVLNVLTLRPLPALPAAEPMDYGAESAEGRRLRRESRWTPMGETSL